MSRNAEKSQSLLYRFQEQQAAELGIIDAGRTHRPRNTAHVETVPMCEKWRSQVVREISRKVEKIQDISLTEFQIRDLNDEINKLMREKHAWEIRIKDLGGPNYLRFNKAFDSHGNSVPIIRGYRYFGRSRELPGVKELLLQQEEELNKLRRGKNLAEEEFKKRTKINRLKNLIGPDYYGYRDEIINNIDLDSTMDFDFPTESENESNKRSAVDNDNSISNYTYSDPLLIYEQQITQNNFKKQLKNNDNIPKSWCPIGDIESIPTINEIEFWLIEREKKKILEKFQL